jgi:hypothetical protein
LKGAHLLKLPKTHTGQIVKVNLHRTPEEWQRILEEAKSK